MENVEEWLSSYKRDLGNNVGGDFSSNSVIAVSSGKGGVGKTTISLKLAECLANDSYKVLVVDCDYNLSNTSVQLGLNLQNDFFKLLNSQKSFYECVQKVKGFDLLAACNGDLELFNNDMGIGDILLDIIASHKSDYDVVILDCPAGLNLDVLSLCAYADFRIMVATPDPSSITDTYSSIKILKKKFNISVNHLVVNKVSSDRNFKRVVKTISETAERFLTCQTKVLGAVYENKKILSQERGNFFSGKNFLTYENVIKVLNKYSEEVVTGFSVASK